jgi:hypothetical protein
MSLPKPHFARRHLPYRLRRLIGTWTVEGHFVGGTEGRRVRGSVTFRWLVKDALVVTRTRMTVAPRFKCRSGRGRHAQCIHDALFGRARRRAPL